MLDLTALAEAFDAQAREHAEIVTAEHDGRGPVDFSRAERHEAQADAWREAADALRAVSGQRRDFEVAYTTRDGVDHEVRFEPTGDGAIRLEALDDYLSEELTLSGVEELSGAVVRLSGEVTLG